MFRVWEPTQIDVVIGQSNKPEQEVHLDRVREDGVGLIKRRSGGGAVVLAPGMVVSSVVINDIPLKHTQKAFNEVTHLFVEALTQIGVEDVSHRGRSDICIGDRKIMGASIYRNQSQLLYHNVMLVSADLSLIERYLKHPSREPDYRKSRSHLDFVTSLHEKGYTFSSDEIKKNILTRLPLLRETK